MILYGLPCHQPVQDCAGSDQGGQRYTPSKFSNGEGSETSGVLNRAEPRLLLFYHLHGIYGAALHLWSWTVLNGYRSESTCEQENPTHSRYAL